MRGSQEKLVLAVLAVYLLVGALTATSAMIPHGIEGDEKSSWHVDKDGLRRTFGRKESFGWPNVIAKKVVPTRNLRTVAKKSAPPAPIRNKATTQRLLLYLQSLPDAY